MGTVVVLAILAGVVALIVRKMIKDKKNGKSIPVSYTHLTLPTIRRM